MSNSSSQCRRPGIDLQLCLLHLPTPVIAICQSRTVTFANRAAEALLNHESQIQSTNGFIGRQLAELDISLLYNETWESALDKLDSAQRFSQDDIAGTGTEVREVVAVVGKPGSEGRSRHFRVLISSLAGRDETSHVLSFELSSNIKSVPTVGSSAALDGTAVPENEAGTAEFHDTQQYKAATFDDSKVAGFIISSDVKFYIPNKKTKEIFGDSIGDPHKHHYPYTKCAEFWNEQFTDKVRDDLLPGLRMAKTRKPYKDYRYGLRVIPTGERYILNSSGECLYDNAGQFIGGVCWFTSFQKLSEYLACERQKDLRSHETICNLLPHMVWTTAADGITSDWFSKRWFDYTGMTEEEASGTGFAKAFHPDDCPHIFKVLEKHNVSKEEFQIQMRFRRHDGCYRYMIARAAPILDENGELLRWYGTNTDIHEATVARLQADFIKDQIMAVLAHADVSLFAIDRERSITMSEGRTINVVALVGEGAPSDFVGMNAIELARALDLPGSAIFEKNLNAILSGEAAATESEDFIKDKVYKTRMVADFDESKNDDDGKPTVKGVLGLAVDVTDMKARAKLELDNARLIAEEQAAKDSNLMKSQFLANMSHELRTPTAGVIGMVDLLSEDQTLSSEQRECVNSIQLSAKALLTIVNDILDFSKIESGRFDIEEIPFNLAATVGGLCQLLTMFAQQKGLEFVYVTSLDDGLEFIGDAGRIRQVLSNLLMNALKFTDKGMVKISVSGTKLEPKRDDHEALQVKFVIEDTGIGIEKHVLKRLFTPFHQGDASTARLYGGTGLGLTISQNLARLMHGSIELTSTPAVGSTATFTLLLKVSSWSRDIPIARSSSEMQCQAQSLPRTPVHRDMLNRQISEIVTSGRTPQHSYHLDKSPEERGSDANSLTPEQRSRIYVLIVEDNAINQTIALKIIRKLGFSVAAVSNGREALDYLLHSFREDDQNERRPPRRDIILMDVQMPVMDGYEATQILRGGKEYVVLEESSPSEHREQKGKARANNQEESLKSLRNLPIIAMTASAIQGDDEKCRAAGMDDYLPKPVDKDKLEELLLKWATKSNT